MGPSPTGTFRGGDVRHDAADWKRDAAVIYAGFWPRALGIIVDIAVWTPVLVVYFAVAGLSIPAAVYFLWVVHGLYRESPRDWNRVTEEGELPAGALVHAG